MNKKKGIFNAVFLVVIFLATIYYVFHGKDIDNLIYYIHLADSRYWMIAVLFVMFFILGESVIIYYLMRSVGQSVIFGHCCLYSFIGFFFSCVTPSASGGQPMQLVYMKKDGIPISLASYILLIVTIGYKLVLVLLGATVMLLRPNKLMQFLKPAWGWFILGIVLNVVVVGFMLLLLFESKLAEVILKGVACIGSKLHLIKNEEKWGIRIRSLVTRYQQVSRYLRMNPKIAFNVIILSIIQRFFLFAVTAVVYVSFGLNEKSLLDITLLQGMISVAADMLPMPGGLGISEGLFLVMFEPVFGKLTLPGMVVSRGISFYTQLLICMIMTVIAHFRIKKKKE